MSGVVGTAVIDARQDHRIGSQEGLARRIGELERRLASFGVRQSDKVAPFTPWVRLSGVGPLQTTTPPSSTSGTPFEIPVPGVYACFSNVTGFVSAGGMARVDVHFDGNATPSANCELFFNSNDRHLPLHSRWHTMSFAKGTHYHWLRQAVLVQLDSNDRWDFFAFRVGALA